MSLLMHHDQKQASRDQKRLLAPMLAAAPQHLAADKLQARSTLIGARVPLQLSAWALSCFRSLNATKLFTASLPRLYSRQAHVVKS